MPTKNRFALIRESIILVLFITIVILILAMLYPFRFNGPMHVISALVVLLVFGGLIAAFSFQVFNRLLVMLEPESSIQITSRLLKLLPKSSYLLRMRADAFVKIRKYPSAMADLNTAIAGRPKDISLIEQRLLMNLRRYNYEAMLSDAETILEMNPRHLASQINRSLALQMLGRYEESLIANDKAQKQATHSQEKALIYINRAVIYREMGELDKAENQLHRINLRKIPRDQRNIYLALQETNYAMLALLNKHYSKARIHYQNAMDTWDQAIGAQAGMAIIEYLTGNKGEAKRRWKTLKSEYPEYGDGEWVAAELALPDDLARIVVEIAEA